MGGPADPGSSKLRYSLRNIGTRTAGRRTRPSACRLFSSRAESTRGTARPEPLMVCTNSGYPSPSNGNELRATALKSLEFEQLETSSQRFWPADHTSRSYFFDWAKPRSPRT